MVNPEPKYQPPLWQYEFDADGPLCEEAVEEGFRIMESELVCQGATPSNDAAKIARWSVVFGKMTNGQFLAAAGKAMVRLKFFPKPVELDELAYGSIEERAETAWANVRGLVSRHGGMATWYASDIGGDGAALWAANRVGRDVIHEMTERNQPFVKKDFVAAYRSAIEGGMTLPKIRGTAEAQNGAAAETLAHYGRSAGDCPPELVGVARDARPELVGRGLRVLPAPSEIALEEFKQAKATQALPQRAGGDNDPERAITDLARKLRQTAQPAAAQGKPQPRNKKRP